MKFYKKYFVGLLFCLALTVTPIGSKVFDKDSQLNVVNAAIPAAAGIAAALLATTPGGWLALGGLGLIHVISVLLIDTQDDVENTPLTNLDLLQIQSEIINEINKVDRHVLQESARIIRVLAHKIESHAFTEEMRNTLEYLKKECAEQLGVVMNSKIPASAKESTMNLMLNPHSAYREKLRYFITRFIKSNIRVPATESVKLFFEYILQMDNLLAIENENGYKESMHTQVFKAYMFIAKILTDGYVMPIAAHVIQYQGQINHGQLRSANHTKNLIQNLINNYKNDMKALIDKTERTLENTSREIRNPGTFNHYVKGETFDSFNFAVTYPTICFIHEPNQPPNMCFDYPAIPNLSKVTFYRNSYYNDGYHYDFIEYEKSNNRGSVFLGHNNSDAIREKTKLNGRPCPIAICSRYLEKSAAISTEPVVALPGNVITGVRFRMHNGMLYIDIQQGKFQDMLSVVPGSVFWTRTPAGGSYEILSNQLKKLELGNWESVNSNKYLTGIQLRKGQNDIGLITVHMLSSEIPFDSSERSRSFPMSEFNELPLKKLDDPTMGSLKNLISPPPHNAQRYFIDFQHSSVEKDFARSTIPFIDTREVISNPPAPMKGFGIYHEAGAGSGGFIALKLISPELTEFANYAKQVEQFTNSSKKV